MSRSDRVSIRPSCFGRFSSAASQGCLSCKSSIDCIPQNEEMTMAGDKSWMEIPYQGDQDKETPRSVHVDDHQVGGDHYRSKAVQPWSAMASWMSPDEFSGFLRGNVIKYVARCNDKGGIEDLLKARHYLDKLIEVRK